MLISQVCVLERVKGVGGRGGADMHLPWRVNEYYCSIVNEYACVLATVSHRSHYTHVLMHGTNILLRTHSRY